MRQSGPGSRPGLRRLWLMCLAALLAAPPAATAQDLSLVSIATGARTGVYYAAGGRLCALLNAHRWTHGIRCLVETSDGSIDTLRALRAGRVTFGIVQADWQRHAVNGTGPFDDLGPDRTLRSLFALFPEAFTVVAGRETAISRLDDLIGKRVSFGPAGSGSRATMGVVLDAMGLSESDFAEVLGLGASETRTAICDGEIDAAVFIIAHPNLAVEDMLTACGARLVPATGPAIAELVAGDDTYFGHEIAAGTYAGQHQPVPVFALAATLVTSARVQPEIVHALVGSVFDDIDGFRQTHPALSQLAPGQPVHDSLSAPLHSGARRYFDEHGLR